MVLPGFRRPIGVDRDLLVAELVGDQDEPFRLKCRVVVALEQIQVAFVNGDAGGQEHRAREISRTAEERVHPADLVEELHVLERRVHGENRPVAVHRDVLGPNQPANIAQKCR